jgi:putative endonuclease
LLYFERHIHIEHAIEREKEIKNLTRIKKEELISMQNPKYHLIKI